VAAMLKNSEVTAIVFHFILSIVIIGAYLITVIMKAPDTMLQSAALIVVGYWFGKVGDKVLTSSKKTKDDAS
jgi:hypothetical protein